MRKLAASRSRRLFPFLSRTTTSRRTSCALVWITGAAVCGGVAWAKPAGASRTDNRARLTGVLFMGPHDTDVVIREFVVCSWQLELRHVAARAILGCNLAQFHDNLFRTGVVTRKAFGIVSGGFRFHSTMRVVAGGATDSRVGRVVALTVRKTVWLKTHVADIVRTVERDLRPGAVAAPAGFGHFLGTKLRKFRHG